MNITCSKDLLINNISIVSKAVAQKTTQPILECILLVADRKGFRLMSNNLELSIETSNMDCDVYETGAVALDAKLFANIIRSLPEESVKIISDENNRTTITCGKAEFKLPGKNAEDFPKPPELNRDDVLKVKSSIFKNIIKQTIFSVAIEDTRPVLTGEFLEITPKKINVVAIDGYRVSFRTTPVEYTTYKDIIVPARTLTEISSIASSDEDEYINIYIQDRHALFEMKNCIMVSRLIEGRYMEYDNLFNSDSTTSVKTDRNELLRALERAVIVVKDPKRAAVNLDIKENTIDITAKAETGEVFEQVAIENNGSPLSINFNANYIIDVLKNIEDESVKINFMSPLSPCIIKDDEETYKYLVLPLKLQ